MADTRTVMLGDVANINIGRTPSRSNPAFWTRDTTHPFCTIGDMSSRQVDPRREGVSELAVSTNKAKRVPAGSLLLSFKLTIGKVGFAARDIYPNEAIAWIEPTSQDVDLAYLSYSLEQADLYAYADPAVKGATLNKAKLKEIELDLPLLPVQQRIAQVLDAATEACETQLATLTAARRTRENLLFQLVTDVPDDTVEVPLAKALVREVRAIDVLSDSKYHQIGIRSFGKGTFHKPPVTGAELGNKAIYEIREGDFMFNIVFAWEGAVAVAGDRDDGLCASHRFPTYRPAAGVVDADYLRLFFETSEGRELLDLHSPGTAGRNRTLNREALLAEPVRLPSLESQLRTVSLIRQADEVVRCAAEDLAARRALRRALMDDLITGAHPFRVEPRAQAAL